MMLLAINSGSIQDKIKSYGNLSLVLLLHLMVISGLSKLHKPLVSESEAKAYIEMLIIPERKVEVKPPAEFVEKKSLIIQQSKHTIQRQTASSSNPQDKLPAPETQIRVQQTDAVEVKAAADLFASEGRQASDVKDNLKSVWENDIKKIYRQTKHEFAQRDQVMPAAKVSDLDALARKIAGSAQTNRVGVYYENFVLPDGRPVTKVNTPYGSYCILLDKPGENPDLRLPKVPVTCAKF